MTAEEIKMTAWEMDATASALEANVHRLSNGGQTLEEWTEIMGKAEDEIGSLQAYAHALQAEAAKEGAR